MNSKLYEGSLKTINGDLNAKGMRIAVVGARWNNIFSDKLVEGAVEALLRHGASESDLTIVRVPGSFELPVVCRELALSKNFEAIVAIGVLIKGETDHYQLICNSVTSGITQISQQTGVPVTFGVLTTENMEQAMARSGCKAGNKGEEAALAAVETVNVLRKLKG